MIEARKQGPVRKPVRSWRSRRWVAASAALATIAMIGLQPGASFGQGGGGGGTAKPPPKGTPPPPARVFPSLPAPVFTGGGSGVADLHQFDMTGKIALNASGAPLVNAPSTCPAGTDARNVGGTVTVNGIAIVVPCNLIVQMPANTLTWADFVNGPSPLPLTSLEAHVIGNIVGGGATPQHIAGLIYVSQQALNQGQGIITSIDYTTGNIHVGTKVGAPDQAVVQINDPNHRFGRAQSPDPRFSVDDANPTIHAATGYPMCVPRSDPAVTDDALCPQKNRPKTLNAAGLTHCRDWLDAGMGNNLPKGQNLRAPFPGQVYCGHFVMEDPALAAATAPNSNQQAPFEVGDYITYAGTVMPGDSVIYAHTIEAQVAIYTQPGTKPSYLAIGQFGVGTADPNITTAVNGAGQETQNRIFLEAETTDPYTLVDIYLPDAQTAGPTAGGAPMNPSPGTVHNRWITPFEMTGEPVNTALSTVAPYQGQQINPYGGGILTMMTGVQTPRARLRATKAPVGLLDSPTRNIRVVARSLCTPGTIDTPVVPTVNGAASTAPAGACTDSVQAANGLSAGQYLAPDFGFIFPENTQKGEPVVPNDLWHLGFLINGEGGTGPLTPGALSPSPW
jgi:hypothetical protein